MEGNDQGDVRTPPAGGARSEVDPAAAVPEISPGISQPVEQPVDGFPLKNGAAGQSPVADTNLPRANRAYAALDLGTNNCRLLVARPSPRGFKVIDAFSRIIRLGEGVAASRRLSQSAIERTIEALKVCAAKIRDNQVVRSGLIATEACRSAENGAEFLNDVRERVGIDLEIVDRETEARLAVVGCSALIDREAKSTVLFSNSTRPTVTGTRGSVSPMLVGAAAPVSAPWLGRGCRPTLFLSQRTTRKGPRRSSDLRRTPALRGEVQGPRCGCPRSSCALLRADSLRGPSGG